MSDLRIGAGYRQDELGISCSSRKLESAFKKAHYDEEMSETLGPTERTFNK